MSNIPHFHFTKWLLTALVIFPLLSCKILQAGAGKKTEIVFISGTPSHGPMAHEHRAGNIILANALNAAIPEVDAIVLPENGYPADPGALEDAASIVIFCTGHRGICSTQDFRNSMRL